MFLQHSVLYGNDLDVFNMIEFAKIFVVAGITEFPIESGLWFRMHVPYSFNF